MKSFLLISLIILLITFFSVAAGQQIAENAGMNPIYGHIEPSTSVIKSVTINQSISSAIFFATWPDEQTDLGLALIAPNGTRIDQNSNVSSIAFEKNPTYEYYVVQNPAEGVWSFEINASRMLALNGSDYCLKLIGLEMPENTTNNAMSNIINATNR